MAQPTIGHLIQQLDEEHDREEKRHLEQRLKADQRYLQLAQLNKNLTGYFKAQKRQSLDEIEEKRESKKKVRSLAPTFSDLKLGKKDGMFGTIGAIGGIVTGLVIGFFEGLVDSIRTLFRIVIPERIREGFKKFKTKFNLRFAAFIDDINVRFFVFFDDIRKSVTTFFSENKQIQKLKDLFSKIGKGIGMVFKPFTLIAGFVGSIFTNAFNPKAVKDMKAVGDTVKKGSKGGGIFKTLGTVLEPFFSVFRRIGRFLGGPITVAFFSIIDGFIGAFEGFTETEGSLFSKIMGAISGGVSGVISGFVGGLLDLGKMLVGWVAGLFGFDDFKASLDEFSFQDTIFDGLMWPFRQLNKWLASDGEGSSMWGDMTLRIRHSMQEWFSRTTDMIIETLKRAADPRNWKFFGGEGVTMTSQLEKKVADGKITQEEMDRQLAEAEYVPLAERTAEQKADFFNREEARIRKELQESRAKFSAMTAEEQEEDKGKWFGRGVSDNIEDLRKELIELNMERKAFDVPVIAQSNNTTNNSSSTAMIVDPSPTKNPLDTSAYAAA